jgi:hypothetical protein
MLQVVACAVVLCSSPPLLAETVYLFGNVGGLPIVASIDRSDGALSGWYFYRSKAQEIQIGGTIDRNGTFQMEESKGGKKTGIFKGSASQGKWAGIWQKPDGRTTLPFSMTESRDLLKNLKGDYRCALQERRAESRSTYKWDLTLSVIDGVVSTLRSIQGAYGDEKDEQTCSIDLMNVKPIPSDAGILLQAKPGQGDGGNQKCTIRILGDEDTLWIRFGDSASEGNDCRSAGAEMYCSPRAFWNDIVIDRHTKKCRALQ